MRWSRWTGPSVWRISNSFNLRVITAIPGTHPITERMTFRTWITRLLSVVLLCAIIAPPVQGESGNDTASKFARKRLVQRFDFEEAKLGNFESLPMHWFRVGSRADTSDPNFDQIPFHQMLVVQPGYPRYTQVRFDKPQAEPGDHSFYFALNGGNAGAFLQAGAVPAVPNSDYLITARVRTDELEQARARLCAFFIDGKGRLIDKSIIHTGLITTEGEWRELGLRLPGDFPNAAWISLRIDLLQQKRADDHPLGKHQVIYTDVTGKAWFDDIAIWQLPNVRIQTQSSVNIVRAPDKPQIKVTVRDLTGRPLVSRVTVHDHTMRVVQVTQRVVGAGAPSVWLWEPPLEGNGWYMADLTIHEMPADRNMQNLPPAVARTIGAFLWLADEPSMKESEALKFNLQAEDISNRELALLPDLIDTARIPTVTLSSWARDTTLHTLEKRMSRLDRMLSPLQGVGRGVQFSFSPVPEELAQTLDVDESDPLAMFRHPISAWSPLLKPILIQHGQRVHEWQLGTPDEPVAFYDGDVNELLNSLKSEFENLAPQPNLVVPWLINQQRRRDLDDNWRYLIDVPHRVQPRHIAEHLVEWNAQPTADYQLHLREPDATELDHPGRVDDLALRMIHGWEAGANGLAISHAWAVGTQRQPELLPDPLLGVFSAVTHRLAGRRALRRMQLRPGLQCVILHGQAGGAIALWNESASADQTQLRMYVGQLPERVDVWGNRTALPVQDDKHVIDVERTPIFVEGIDTLLMLFRASFEVDEPFIESLQKPHQRVIRLQNPWARTISGFMTITQPERWRIQPERIYFSIAAGETHEIPIQMLFPVSEVAGTKMLEAHFDFTADQHYVVDFATPLTVGLKDIDFDANLSLELNPKTGKIDAIVTQLITNRGTQPLSLYAFANLHGYPRRERTVSGLKPGQSVVRRFRFADADEATRDYNIRVGLRQTSGPAVLNYVLKVED